jgi:hypothetical protein
MKKKFGSLFGVRKWGESSDAIPDFAGTPKNGIPDFKKPVSEIPDFKIAEDFDITDEMIANLNLTFAGERRRHSIPRGVDRHDGRSFM